jgi:hypothetical protein
MFLLGTLAVELDTGPLHATDVTQASKVQQPIMDNLRPIGPTGQYYIVIAEFSDLDLDLTVPVSTHDGPLGVAYKRGTANGAAHYESKIVSFTVFTPL